MFRMRESIKKMRETATLSQNIMNNFADRLIRLRSPRHDALESGDTKVVQIFKILVQFLNQTDKSHVVHNVVYNVILQEQHIQIVSRLRLK